MALRVLVVDDEPLTREMVAALAAADAEVGHVEQCADAMQAAAAIARVPPDIVLLDVQMPDIDGIRFTESLSEHGPVVVFITAYSDYAMDAFAVGAVDYLLKPFSDQRFHEAFGRAKRRVREKGLARQAAGLDTGRAPDHIVLAFGEIALEASDILWIEAQDYYVRIHTAGARHLVRATLASCEERLDAATFLRVHRAAIVNRHAIREVADTDGTVRLVLSDGSSVPVSRARRKAIETVVRGS